MKKKLGVSHWSLMPSLPVMSTLHKRSREKQFVSTVQHALLTTHYHITSKYGHNCLSLPANHHRPFLLSEGTQSPSLPCNTVPFRVEVPFARECTPSPLWCTPFSDDPSTGELNSDEELQLSPFAPQLSPGEFTPDLSGDLSFCADAAFLALYFFPYL